ncbi:MAG: CRISPR-associated helicase Cas3' [Dehalococcoidia bacterium]|nr:CRISPR-associated helicase Cas3' [Dehalococcoidia bacterium]
MNDVRNEVLEACLAAAAQQPGFFRLTVPTGGGKTRSGMAFALRHALAHGLRRVIVAVPFITIAKQTSDTLASAFDSPVPDDVTGELARVFPAAALIQHYTGGLEDDADHRRKLAAENWDAPIVVTSTVQLFESLFSNRPSACRKLHRLARSVIILDEAQSLPPGLIEPILDVLRALVRDYGASVVFSTATQPAFETIRGFGELNAREIVPQHPAHFEALRRVRYTHVSEPLPWDAVAARMLAAPAALAIVNTRKHAAELFDAVREQAPAGSVFHLSTRMVQRHRQEVLDEVRQRLEDGLPCYLVSTSVVEASVDVSFPLVLRALAPLDAIVQAAGRCNRHGELGVEGGELVIFEPVDAAMPPGPYRTGAGIMQGVLASGDDIFALATQFDYSRRFFDNLDKDGPNIQELRRSFDYPQVAKDFAMIEPTASVVVPATDPSGRASEVLALVASRQTTRADMRALQPFMVSLPQREFGRLVTGGVVREFAAGLGEWLGAYGDAGIVV